MRTVLLAIVLICVGCATQTTEKQAIQSALSAVTLKVGYVDEAKNLVNNTEGPLTISIEMPIIPGALAGTVMTSALVTKQVSVGETVTIDLSLYSNTISKYATPLLLTEYNYGLTINPKSTKLARLGTFAYDPDSGKFLGPTGIRVFGVENHIQLYLVYFGGPARLIGVGQEQDMLINYDIEAKEEGFVWVEVIQVEEGRVVVTNRRSKGPEILTIEIQSESKHEA